MKPTKSQPQQGEQQHNRGGTIQTLLLLLGLLARADLGRDSALLLPRGRVVRVTQHSGLNGLRQQWLLLFLKKDCWQNLHGKLGLDYLQSDDQIWTEIKKVLKWHFFYNFQLGNDMCEVRAMNLGFHSGVQMYCVLYDILF